MREEQAARTPARRLLRAAAVAGGVAALAVGTSGCVIYRSPDLAQPGLIGPAELDLRACVSSPGSGCPEAGKSSVNPKPDGRPVQVLVAVQAPVSWVLPDLIPAGTGMDPLLFRVPLRRSPSYEAEMTALVPPAAGVRWNGYLSDPFTNYVPGQIYHNRMPFDRLPMPDGGPNTVPPDIVVAYGGRTMSDALGPDRPVVCGLADATVCDDTLVGVGFGAQILHDLRLIAPASVTAAPGTTAVVPVTARFAGPAAPGYSFALTAATTLPGGVATPNVPTLTPPTDSTSTLSTAVTVPANAAPGAYDVTVTATVGGTTGRSTSARISLVVPAPAPRPPASGPGRPSVSLTAVRAITARTARTKGLPVRVATDTATRATITLTQSRRIRIGRRTVVRAVRVARRTVTVLAGTTTVRVKSPNLRPGRVVIRVTGAGFSAQGATVLR